MTLGVMPPDDRERATCANCGRGIFALTVSASGSTIWRHLGIDYPWRQKCAMQDHVRDDTIPAEWLAKPLRPGQAPKIGAGR